MSTQGQDQGQDRVTIRQLPTGVPGLDEILGGGLPEFSFNIIAGAPGGGKTTLAHQIMFANATPERPALYFTVLGEPAIKMLRYQQQFTFFDPAKLDGAIRFINLSQVVLDKDLSAVLDEIVKEVEAANAGIVVVDSFRTVVRKALSQRQRNGAPGVRPAPGAAPDQLAGHHVPDRRVRRRRAARQPGVHRGRRAVLALPERRAQLDRAQAAGHEAARPGVRARPAHLPHHRATACKPSRAPSASPTGNQATSRASGVFPPASANSTRCWAAASPKATACSWPGPPDRASRCSASSSSPRACARASRASSPSSRSCPTSTCSGPPSFGLDFDKPQKDGKLKLIYLRPLDLSVDETVHEIVNAVKEIGCKRLVIDSLVGFEMALAPGFRTTSASRCTG